MSEGDAPQADRPTPQVMQLEVTNRNDFTINDRFDGVPLSFPPGEKVTITPAMALHCFGYPGESQDMALHMAKRYGWSGRDYLRAEGTGDGPAKFQVLAANIAIVPVYFELRRVDPNAPIPADDGSVADDDREPVAHEADTSTKVGKRKRTPAVLGGTKRRQRAPGRDTGGR